MTMTTTPPAHGCTQAEFEGRTERAQRRMRKLEIDVMRLTTETHALLQQLSDGAELLSKPAAAEMPIIR